MAPNKKVFTLQEEGLSYSTVSAGRRYVTLILCFLECFIFGGTIFGWNVLVFTLKADGIYVDACAAEIENTTTSNPATLHATGATEPSVWHAVTTGPSGTYGGQYALPGAYDTQYVPPGVYGTQYAPPGVYGTQYAPGVYSGNDVNCDARARHFSLSFTIATVLMGVMALPAGWVFDRTGLLITRLIATAVSLPAFLILAFVTPETSPLIYLGAVLLGQSSFLMFLTNYHVTGIAGPRSSTWFSICSGGVTSSGMVFLFVKLANDGGVDRSTCLLFLTSLWSIVIFTTLVLLPRYKIGHVTTYIHDMMSGLYVSHRQTSIHLTSHPASATSPSGTPTTNGTPTEMSLNDVYLSTLSASVEKIIPPSPPLEPPAPFSDSALSWPYIFNVYYFSCNHLRLLYFLGTFNLWANQVTDYDTDKVSVLTDIFGFANLLSLIIAPIVGLLIDRKKKQLAAAGVTGVQRAVAVGLPILITLIVQLIFSTSVLLTDQWSDMAYIAPCLVHITRGLFYASGFGFIPATFPPEHLGRLIGLQYLVAGLVNFLQYALLSWSNTTDSQLQPNIALLALTASTFIHPILIYWRHQKYMKTQNSK